MMHFRAVYPNQKIVTIHKEPADKEHIYGIFNKEALYAACRNLSGNELKAFLYLSSNQPGYCGALSTSDMREKIGSTEDGMRTAIRGLERKRYMVKREGNLYDFYEYPSADEMCSQSKEGTAKIASLPRDNLVLSTEKTSIYNVETEGEIIQKENKKNTINKSVDRNKVIPYEWENVFRRINVTPNKSSIPRIEKVVGKTLEARVIDRLISQNQRAFDKGMDQKEGYRFGILLNLSEEQYDKWERIVVSEEAERQREREELCKKSRINYENIYVAPISESGLSDEEFFEMLNSD